MRYKIIGTVSLVLAIIVFVTTGTSFAYFTVMVSNTGDPIEGTVTNFDVNLEADEIYNATQLIPIEDSQIKDAIAKTTNKCKDSKGYDVCSLYSLNLTNSGDAQVLNGYIKTLSTTYITDNLRCQLFDTNYNAVSDIITISRSTADKIYFKQGTNNVATEINNTDISYYLAIWLHETNAIQNEDFSKNYSGKITFESINGQEISAVFTS